MKWIDFRSLELPEIWELTYVSHVPIEGNQGPRTISIQKKFYPERTMRQTRCGVTCGQCDSSSKDRAATARFEYPSPIRRLTANISLLL